MSRSWPGIRAEGNDPRVLAQRAEIEYGAQVVLYPAPGGDHSALAPLLSELADSRFPPAVTCPPGRPLADGAGSAGRRVASLAIAGEVGAAGGAGGAFHRAG